MYLSLPAMCIKMLNFIRTDVLIILIRDNPEFQQILNEAEAKYRAVYERLRYRPKEIDMLLVTSIQAKEIQRPGLAAIGLKIYSFSKEDTLS